MSDTSAVLDRHVSAIERDLEALYEERDRLEAARAHLVGADPVVPKRKPRVSRARSRVRAETPQQRRRRIVRNAVTSRAKPPAGTKRVPGSVRRVQILERISTRPGVRNSEIAADLKISEVHVRSLTRTLLREGEITRVGRGYGIAKAAG